MRLTISLLKFAKFQSTLPAWGATQHGQYFQQFQRFQSTLPAWGATFSPLSALGAWGISIHAPRMGSDDRKTKSVQFIKISIHAPRMGSDASSTSAKHGFTFQSTLPAWGATSCALVKEASCIISIHAPRMGSDDP